VRRLPWKIDGAHITTPNYTLENGTRASIDVNSPNKPAIHIAIFRYELQTIHATRKLRIGAVTILTTTNFNRADRIPACHRRSG
jgi:hypothetical protein